MLDVEVISDPVAAPVALEPVRSRLLSELAEPASAATLASRLGIARQRVNYHLRALENVSRSLRDDGFVRQLRSAKTRDEVWKLLEEADQHPG